MLDGLLFEAVESGWGFIIRNGKLLAGTGLIATPIGYFLYPLWTNTVHWWESTQEWKITDGGKPETRDHE